MLVFVSVALFSTAAAASDYDWVFEELGMPHLKMGQQKREAIATLEDLKFSETKNDSSSEFELGLIWDERNFLGDAEKDKVQNWSIALFFSKASRKAYQIRALYPPKEIAQNESLLSRVLAGLGAPNDIRPKTPDPDSSLTVYEYLWSNEPQLFSNLHPTKTTRFLIIKFVQDEETNKRRLLSVEHTSGQYAFDN